MWLTLALAATVVFGLRGILYHWSALQPIDRNLVLLGTFATGALVCLSLGFILDQTWTGGSLVGLLMGLFTFGANMSVYQGFAAGKSSLPALFTSMSPVPVLLVSFLLWGETVNVRQLIAFIIIVTGVVLIRYAGRQSLQRLQGMRWGLLALLFFALGDLSN
jgi:drug/metabolite transporter (DMT)-like permease